MERFDLRKKKGDVVFERMTDIIENIAKDGEVIIFMFEVGDFSPVHKSHEIMKELGHEVMNSIKFNEVDWSLVVKRKVS